MDSGGRILILAAASVFLLAPLMACASDGPGSDESGGSKMSLEKIGIPPGIETFPDELRHRLAVALSSRRPDYVPRTHHLLPEGGPKYTNRLILESSPYLLQHAHNPVNWYSWGDAAFEAAAAAGKPVLLSVGYSTCHWCHVMEEESFEDEEIARYMNENYIAIKVDREERPDVDAVYMAAVQAISGRGGWPMTVWLTPDRQPFYGGTYYPARDGDRGAGKGFLSLLRDLQVYYHANPDRITEMAGQLSEAVRGSLAAEEPGNMPGTAALESAVNLYKRLFDPVHGGVGGAPKFPSSLPIGLLFRYHRRTGDTESLRMAELTLEKMAGGGMYDHVGGGFHRYSTDQRWLVPHFEKMLYDNAQLVPLYLEGYQLTGRADFARVAREVLDYVEREMTAPEGGFFSATDADSEGEEGTFFIWTLQDVRDALGPERAEVVIEYYNLSEAGNFEGRNILHTPYPLATVATRAGTQPDTLWSVIEESRRLLYETRSRRIPPGLDDKVLTGWNGLMISAFARAASILEEPGYARSAERAADFLLRELRQDGRLLRSWRAGAARGNAYLDDYAFLIAGLIDLYETTFRIEWLQEAIALQEVLERHYSDPDNGGYFQTSDDHEKLLVREKPDYDGAVPSGNSVAVMNLLRLHEFTATDGYRQRAAAAFRAFGATLEKSPGKLAEMLLALDYHLDSPKEIVIVTPPGSADQAGPFLAELRSTYLPNRILAVVAAGDELDRQTGVIPLLKNKIPVDGQATAYVCENRVCALPTGNRRVFAEQIARVTPLHRAGKVSSGE
jgi:uncharacterized protein YyaL (SSP411 family)